MHARTVRRPARIPAGANEDGDGIVIGDGPVTVDAWIDFQCPYCRMFEEASGPVLDLLIREGRISLVSHPVAFLDAMSTNLYSTRASAASGCAADGGRYREYAYLLFANQPPEGGPGLTDNQLAALGGSIGLGASFAGCVGDGTHLDWPPYVTELATANGVSGTPTVTVAGVPVAPHPGLIRSAVAVAASRLEA
jgi:protein-disulfide isomerase